MTSKYKLRSIFPSKLSLVAIRESGIINAFTGARYGATNRIYIAAPALHHARSSRSLRFIVLFWQLPAVNSRLINNRTGNIIAVPRGRHIRTKHRCIGDCSNAIVTDKRCCQERIDATLLTGSPPFIASLVSVTI